jgi:hypothetical protein
LVSEAAAAGAQFDVTTKQLTSQGPSLLQSKMPGSGIAPPYIVPLPTSATQLPPCAFKDVLQTPAKHTSTHSPRNIFFMPAPVVVEMVSETYGPQFSSIEVVERLYDRLDVVKPDNYTELWTNRRKITFKSPCAAEGQYEKAVPLIPRATKSEKSS